MQIYFFSQNFTKATEEVWKLCSARFLLTGGSGDLLHPVEGGPGLEPMYLLLIEGVVQKDGAEDPSL